jgi:hypothetical protein
MEDAFGNPEWPKRTTVWRGSPRQSPRQFSNVGPMQRSAPDAHSAVPVEADGVTFQISELLGVVLGLSAVVVYVVAGLALITLGPTP